MEEHKQQLLPVLEGFRFECQRCGFCCNNLMPTLTINELSYFSEHDLKLRYFVKSERDTGKIHIILPCKPPNEECWAYCHTENKCLIYQHRPIACRMYPFIVRVYHKSPPTYNEVVASLDGMGDTQTIRKYIHTVDENRWLFLAYKVDKRCPGFDKGKPWKKGNIKRLVSEMVSDYENFRADSNEVSDNVMTNLGIEYEKDLHKHFLFDREVGKSEIVSDMGGKPSNIKFALYIPVNALPDIALGSMVVKKDILGNKTVTGGKI